MWKRFDFAPIAIVEPKRANGTEYSSNNIFRDLLVEAFGEEPAREIFDKALKRAQDASVVVNPARSAFFETYANGLSYPVFAPATAEQLERGNALPLPATGSVAGFAVEWAKIRRTVRAVCERFKGTYGQARTAFETATQYDVNGKTQTSGTTDSQTHFDEYFRGGSSGVSSTPTGRTATETGASNESLTQSLGGFLDVWQGLVRFNDGEVVSPATVVVDAIFDALFVEYTPVGDVLVFGDQKMKIWGE